MQLATIYQIYNVQIYSSQLHTEVSLMILFIYSPGWHPHAVAMAIQK